jgi:TolB-like protein/Tfp pilus assembly protein PilF
MIGHVLSHYRIVDRLGAGGMGEVYLAEDTKLKRKVALKVLPPDVAAHAGRLERFQREAEAVAALSHPNIVTIYSVEEAEGIHFITMEHVLGEPLDRLIPPHGFEPESFFEMALPLTDAVAAAHERGITHRDLKPANVMVGADGRVRILDFGLAKIGVAGSSDPETPTLEQTQEGTILGTLPYMSPEQAQGLVVDHRTDVFSLGAVLYEMLSGRRPFQGASSAALISSILRDEPAPIGRTGVPAALERVVMRCLAKKPEDRYSRLRDLHAEIRACHSEIASQTGRELLAASPRAAAGPTGEPATPSLAVLPFTDMSPDKDQDYFCEGMAEEIINALAHVDGLQVAARTSAFSFKGRAENVRRIGDELKVGLVLEGSIRKAGSRLRVTAQLVNVADGYQLWSEKYDRELADVFAVQDEITAAIVEALKAKLGMRATGPAMARRDSPSVEVYELYLRGRYHWSTREKSGLQTAMACFAQAIERDPAFARAHAGLADCYSILGFYGFLPPKELIANAKACARKALDLDDRQADAYAALGYLTSFFDWNPEASFALFERALELDPRASLAECWYATSLAWAGRFKAALDHAQRAQAIDPLSPLAHCAAGLALLCDAQEDAAVSELDRALAIDPDFLFGLFLYGSAQSLRGEHVAALAAFSNAAELTSRATFHVGCLAWASARAGRLSEADAILRELEERSASEHVSGMGLVAASVHKPERALTWLSWALERRDPVLFMACSPNRFRGFDSLRAHPGFDDVRRRFRESVIREN